MSDIVSQLKIEQVEITSTTLGAGSYGEVVEAVWMSTPCAAKRLHRVLETLPHQQHAIIVEKFLRECETWSKLRHPHIVLFLGIVYEVESPLPVLIMEKMDTTLYSFVMERPSEDFPLYRKGSVLLQVALALRYLHNQGLIHRDLTPSNILLDLESFKAKVTDFGVTSFINSGRTIRTSVPGNPAFMPPEASGANPRYDNKLDTFSYGNVVLFAFSKHWPTPDSPTRTINDELRALTEFERRAEYAEHMSSEERRLFLGIIKNCLENNPKRRPSSKEIVEEMNKIKSQIPVEESHQQSVSTEVPLLEAKIRQINTKYFDASTQLVKLKEENEKLRKKCSNGFSSSYKISERDQDGKSETKLANRALFNELIALRKEIKNMTTERKSPEQSFSPSLNRLRFQAGHFGSSYSLSTSQPSTKSPLTPTPSIKWTPGTPLPVKMFMTSAVAINKAVYIGGGYNPSRSQPLTDIYRLDTETGAWVIIPRRDPEHTTSGFAIAAFKERLLVIGGEYSTIRKGTKVSDKILRLDVTSSSGRWNSKMVHSLNTPRYIPEAIIYLDYLLIAGGKGFDEEPVPTMEIMNLEHNKKPWIVTMPIRSDVRPQLVVLKDMLIVGGKRVDTKDTMETHSVSISDVLPNEKKKKRNDPNWSKDRFIPRGAAIFTANDYLVSVGGTGEKSTAYSIHWYADNSWKRYSYRTRDFNGRQRASVVTIGNTVYALGGKDVHQSGQEEPINSVDITTIQ